MLNESTITEIISSQREAEREPHIFTFALTELIFLLFGLLEATIALRMALKLMGANPEFPIIAMIYGFTHFFIFPFTDVVSSPSFGNIELELSSLFTMLIYALVAWALERTAWLIFSRPRRPIASFTQMKTHEYRTLQ